MAEDKIRALVDSQYESLVRRGQKMRDDKLKGMLAIVECLKEGKMTTSELTKATGLKYYHVRYYTSMLRRHEIIERDVIERRINWSLKDG